MKPLLLITLAPPLTYALNVGVWFLLFYYIFRLGDCAEPAAAYAALYTTSFALGGMLAQLEGRVKC